LNNIRVQAANGVLRIDGFIEGLEARRAVNQVLKGVDGLHTAQIDDHLIQE